MHSSDKNDGAKKHSFKRWGIAALFLAVCILANAFLNYALIPPSTVRINLHNLRNGMQYDTVFLGTSHGQYGIDPASVDAEGGGSSVSLCMADAYPDDMYYLLKLTLETQKPSLVVYELDPSYWMNEQRRGSTQVFFYKEFPFSAAKLEYFADKIMKLDFRSTLTPWCYYRNLYGQMADNLRLKGSEAYRQFDPSVLDISVGHYGGSGFIYRNRVEGENKGGFNNIPWDESAVKPLALNYFDKLVKLCRDNSIQLIAITTPVPQETADSFRDSYQAADGYFSSLMEAYEVPYLNFNRLLPGFLDRSMTGYWDYDGHMDGVLAGEFSGLLGRILREMEEGTFDPSGYFESKSGSSAS